jgi:hypothetical protein
MYSLQITWDSKKNMPFVAAVTIMPSCCLATIRDTPTDTQIKAIIFFYPHFYLQTVQMQVQAII